MQGGHARGPRISRTIRVLLAAAALIVIAVVLPVVASSPGTPAGPPPPSALRDPAAVAQKIGLQASDFASGKYGTGWVDVERGQVLTRLTGPCSAVRGGPSLTDQASDVFQWSHPGELVKVASAVAIMPNAADAQASLRYASTAGFGTACLKPKFDQQIEQALPTVSKEGSCPLAMAGSEVTWLAPASLGANGSGFEYTATIECQATGQTVSDSNVVAFEAVGPVCVEVTAIGSNSPTVVAGMMSAVAARARRLVG